MSKCLNLNDRESYTLQCALCNSCPLHEMRNGTPVTFRGNVSSKVALVGLGPGKVEEQTGLPFEGPAGELLEEWLRWIGSTREQLFVSNVTKCRYVAPEGSNKENLTPNASMLKTCADKWLSQEIEIVDPEMIIVTGTAAGVGMNLIKPGQPITPLLGTTTKRTLYGRDRTIFFLRHPASLLYARGYSRDPMDWSKNEKYQALRKEYAQCFNTIRELAK